MSFIYTVEVFKCPLPGMEKLILWILAERANDEGRCFPGQARIAKDAGISYSAVQRNLDKLIAKGLVRVIGQHHYKNTLALGTKEYELDLVAIKTLVAQSLQGYKRRATRGIGSELPGIGGEPTGGSGEGTGVVAESLINQSVENLSVNQSLNLSQQAVTATAAADAAACGLTNLKDIETGVLDYWYHIRLKQDLSEVNPTRIQQDLPFVQELISAVNGNSRNLLTFVFTDPGEGEWAGWDKKTPNLSALVKHIRKGDILVQFAEWLENNPGGEPSPSSAWPWPPSAWEGACRAPACTRAWTVEQDGMKLCDICAGLKEAPTPIPRCRHCHCEYMATYGTDGWMRTCSCEDEPYEAEIPVKNIDVDEL
jgi:hypothetical protein